MSEEITRVRIADIIWMSTGATKCNSINVAKKFSKQGEKNVRAFGSHQRAEGVRLIRTLGWT